MLEIKENSMTFHQISNIVLDLENVIALSGVILALFHFPE